MSYDDPEYLVCTCVNRALRDDERIVYNMPSKDGTIKVYVFAKDCPLHGYTVTKPGDDVDHILTEP